MSPFATHSLQKWYPTGARGAYWLGDSGDRRDHLLSSVHLILGTSECEREIDLKFVVGKLSGRYHVAIFFGWMGPFFLWDEIDFRDFMKEWQVAFLKVVMSRPCFPEDFFDRFPLGCLDPLEIPRPPTQLCAIQPEWPVVGACNWFIAIASSFNDSNLNATITEPCQGNSQHRKQFFESTAA